ncbi:hypothetical protein LWC34_34985 [Kibdelosporangium philippinense]|uniref:Uncharacterized protein n=1 Tax=Kibdelosporangium philippinense TaxID=211113 RepID=A0ABS8ZM08_9PSEU|nr:hypothetical protein [Kibdelosporangium philippinense]MCE7007990.1 hypothetical protein [Kibdelosporangium philippinense]
MTEWSKITKTAERHARLREQVAHMWGDGPALSILVEEFRPAYAVDGRRRNGSFTGQGRIRWFFGRILLPIRNTLLTLLAMVSGGTPQHGFRNSKVSGPATSMAVNFADATRNEHQRYQVDWCWFVWTRNRSALIRVPHEEFRVETLWQGDGPMRPYVDPASRTLRWRDGSTVVLHLDAWEARQAAQLPPG